MQKANLVLDYRHNETHLDVTMEPLVNRKKI